MSQLFKFSWHPLHDPDTFMTVFTYDKNMMDLFLQQHGFDIQTANVEIIDDTISKDDMMYINVFRFGSRKRDMIYNIATTLEIINTVTQAVADELQTCMQFGACALRGEIEIFDRISKLIGELDYVYIMDEIDWTDDNIDTDMYRYQGYPYYEEIAMDASSDRLYTDLYDDCAVEKIDQIIPFTIESYVSIFTAQLLIGEKAKPLKKNEPRLPDFKEMRKDYS
jgi:hypothetical protein